MHIERAANLVGAWAVAVADAVRTATEEELGASGGAPAALIAICAEPGLTIDELRRTLALTHPGAVRLVDRLEERGLVIRRAGRGRSVALHPTDEGTRTHDALLDARRRAIRDVLVPLTVEQQAQLAELVEPVLCEKASDLASLRRLCRLCQRGACDPCPPWTDLDRRDGATRQQAR